MFVLSGNSSSQLFTGKSYTSTVHLAHPSHFHELFVAHNCSYPGLTAIAKINDDSSPDLATNNSTHIIADKGFVLAAKKVKDPDTLSFDEAMKDVDRELWIKAAELEIGELEAHGVWIEVPLSEANGEAVIPATWVNSKSPTSDLCFAS